MAGKTHRRKLKTKFAIVGDGLTEQFYFKHLKDIYGYNYIIRPGLFTNIDINYAQKIINELRCSNNFLSCKPKFD